jgi:CHAT domain-containing protein
VNYAPSARLLLASRDRAARQLACHPNGLPSHLVPVADPYLGPGNERHQLRHALLEVNAARTALGSADQVLYRRGATIPAVLAALAGASQQAEPFVAHLACHATADPLVPLDSHLLLASDAAPDGGRLPLADLLGQPLEGARLIVLSACHSAVSGHEAPSESLSLAAGLLADGAAAVVATQCPVRDLVSAVLMARFYREWAASPHDPAAALAAAQRWLASEPPAGIDSWLHREHPDLHARVVRSPAVREDLQRPLSWAPFALHGS